MAHHEVIVIGIGCMGSATCASLARRGIKVLGLEQHTIPNDLGSSGYQSRIFRLAYYEHADYVPLLKQAYEYWQKLNDLADEPVLLETGGLYMGPEGGDFVELSQASAITHGLEFERLDADAIRARFPVFNIPDEFVGLFEQPAGVLLPELAIDLHAQLARSHGADLREGVRVTAWKQEGTGVTVETDAGTFTGDRLVICSGAWDNTALPGDAVDRLTAVDRLDATAGSRAGQQACVDDVGHRAPRPIPSLRLPDDRRSQRATRLQAGQAQAGRIL